MCQLQVHRHRFQVKLHELYRFMILFVYLVPFLFPKTVKNHHKSLQITKTSNCLSHVSISSLPALISPKNWRAAGICHIIWSSCSFLLSQNGQKPPKTAKNQRKPQNCFSHVLISSWPALIPFHMWWILPILFINYSSGSMWRPENCPLPAKTTINDGKAWIDSDVHRLQINQYRFQVQLNELYRLN